MRDIGSSHQLSGNLHIPHYWEEGGSSRAQVGAETSWGGVKMKEIGASDQGAGLEKEPQESGYVLEAEWMGFADELDCMGERKRGKGFGWNRKTRRRH